MVTSGAAAADGNWVRVCVVADAERVDLAVDVLWTSGARGIEEQADRASIVLIAGFDAELAATTATQRLQDFGFGDVTVIPVIDSGLDGWREFAEPVAAGPFWLVPTWVSPPADANLEQVLWLDPGPTFGSGSHPTTRLVIDLLADLTRPGDRVIDVGCGSGVLAIAAVRLGARSGLGIDIDPACEAVLRANAARNNVSDQVAWSDHTITGLAGDGPPADIVVANLLAPVIVEHGRALTSLVAPEGTLVVSGLLADRWEDSVATLAPWLPTHVTSHDGWTAVALANPSVSGR